MGKTYFLPFRKNNYWEWSMCTVCPLDWPQWYNTEISPMCSQICSPLSFHKLPISGEPKSRAALGWMRAIRSEWALPGKRKMISPRRRSKGELMPLWLWSTYIRSLEVRGGLVEVPKRSVWSNVLTGQREHCPLTHLGHKWLMCYK